jgi:uncharacterized protein YjdB
MKKLLFALAALVLVTSCEGVITDLQNPASSVTVDADKISAVSAVLHGKALLDGASGIVEYGFAYSTSAAGMVASPILLKSDAIDSDSKYSFALSGLTPGTTYYYRSYLYKGGNNYYGETKSFTTKALSSLVRTQDATDIDATSATLNAVLDLTDVVYSSMEYGFWWGTSEGGQTAILEGGSMTGNVYNASLLKLFHRTQYWYKAYVKIDDQTFYGEEKTFTTGVVPVESVSFDKTEYTFNIGSTFTLTATVLPRDATDKSVEWSSDNPYVATVDENGTITAIGKGTATITATTKDQGKTAACAITVVQWVTSIILDKSSLSLVIGDEAMLSVTSIFPLNADDNSYTWSSSDNAIASVDDKGKVTAKSKGTATIMVTANDGSGVFAFCTVIVYKIDVPQAVDMGTVVDGKNIKWASFNLGASSPGEYGLYYAWGETEPKSDYSWDNYRWCNGSYITLTKYNTNYLYGTVDDDTELDRGDDADDTTIDDVARAKLGGKWRMPTDAEWTMLREQCIWTWTTQNGINGRLVTASNGNSIFLPAAGGWDDTGLNGAGSYGIYWSSYGVAGKSYYAWFLHFYSDDVRRDCAYRCWGHSVRPVTE